MSKPCDNEKLLTEMRLDIKLILQEVAKLKESAKQSGKQSGRISGIIWGGMSTLLINLIIIFAKKGV